MVTQRNLNFVLEINQKFSLVFHFSQNLEALSVVTSFFHINKSSKKKTSTKAQIATKNILAWKNIFYKILAKTIF